MLKVLDRVIKKSNFQFEFIDLGGGMGIDYDGSNQKLNLKKYSNAIQRFIKNHNSKIIFEPGRSIIGDTGIMLSKVNYIKKSSRKDFIILDAAMNDLMRPALYNAKHRILPLNKTK